MQATSDRSPGVTRGCPDPQDWEVSPDSSGGHSLWEIAPLCQDELKHGVRLRTLPWRNPGPPSPTVQALDGAERGLDSTAGLVSIVGGASPVAKGVILGLLLVMASNRENE